jgi:hypothetical protein
MGAQACAECATAPVTACGRCGMTRCRQHRLAAGIRCEACEHDWQDEAPTRRAAKLIFAPPLAILSGGLLFGLLLPVSLGGAIGAAVMCGLACGTAFSAGTAACKLVDRSSRALFLRERACGLPPARLLHAPPKR